MPGEPLSEAAFARIAPYALLLGGMVLLLAGTALFKALVVVGALRTGLSAERLLPAGAVFVLALLLASIVMAPVVQETLLRAGSLGAPDGMGGAAKLRAADLAVPWLSFLERHASDAEVRFVAELSGRPAGDPLVSLGAFVLTELVEGLSLAVSILVPFLALDLLVGQALLLTGMAHVPLVTVALPLKLALFLSADGIHRLVRGFVEGYG